MGQRVHFTDNNTVRFTVSAGRVWLYFYQEWSASTRRQVKVNEAVWFNPFTWFTKTSWRTEGTPLSIDVDFLRRDGLTIAPETLQANVIRNNGVRKIVVFFASIGFTSGSSRPGTANIDQLGNDARDVTAIRVRYRFDGEDFVVN